MKYIKSIFAALLIALSAPTFAKDHHAYHGKGHAYHGMHHGYGHEYRGNHHGKGYYHHKAHDRGYDRHHDKRNQW